MINKDNNAYKTIGEVAKELNLRSKNNNNLSTHTIRFWKKNLNKSNLKFLMVIEDIMTTKILNY